MERINEESLTRATFLSSSKLTDGSFFANGNVRLVGFVGFQSGNKSKLMLIFFGLCLSLLNLRQLMESGIFLHEQFALISPFGQVALLPSKNRSADFVFC